MRWKLTISHGGLQVKVGCAVITDRNPAAQGPATGQDNRAVSVIVGQGCVLVAVLYCQDAVVPADPTQVILAGFFKMTGTT